MILDYKSVDVLKNDTMNANYLCNALHLNKNETHFFLTNASVSRQIAESLYDSRDSNLYHRIVIVSIR